MAAIELASPLPPDEWAARLREATDDEGPRSWSGERPVISRVSGRSVRLRKRIGYRNPLQTILTGRLEEHEGCTVFRASAGVGAIATLFHAIWFCWVGLIGGFLSVAAISEMLGMPIVGTPMKGGPRPLVPIIVLVMLACGVGLVRSSRRLARDEERFLVAFVSRVTGSVPAPEKIDRKEPGAAPVGRLAMWDDEIGGSRVSEIPS